MKPDLSDLLIVLGSVVAGVGLYFVAWPLVVVAAGVTLIYFGVRRS